MTHIYVSLLIGIFIAGIVLGFVFRDLEVFYLQHKNKELKAIISEQEDELAEAKFTVDGQREFIDLLVESMPYNNEKVELILPKHPKTNVNLTITNISKHTSKFDDLDVDEIWRG